MKGWQENSIENVIDNALQEVVAEHVLPTAKYQLVDWVTKRKKNSNWVLER